MIKKWMMALPLLLAFGYWASKKFFKKTDSQEKSSSFVKVEGDKSYWTCPMHPQVHMDHPGECPICRMKLVKIMEQAEERSGEEGKGRASVQVSAAQLSLIGIQKQTVEKMNLTARIPVSGRLISSSAVAFQVYESDVRYIRPGLSFKGEGSIYLEKDISGVITSVDSIVDPTSRTVRVVGEIKKGSGDLISETSFRGDIQIMLKNRIAIPASAVLHTGQGCLIYLVENGNKLTPKMVKLGLKTEGFYEVLSGLNEGDILSSGPNFLMDSESMIRGTND